MTKYRGYYIDGVVFKNKKDIDEFVKNAIIEKIKQFTEMLFSGRYDASQMIELTAKISMRERRLHDEFGMSYEEIEMITA